MNIFSSISDLSKLEGPLVLVVGTFDGVHVGHQALIRRAQEEAQKNEGHLVVMTFDQHPAALLRPAKAPRLLTSTTQKIKLLEQLEVGTVLLLPFNEALAAVPAESFIHQLVAAARPLKTICVGGNWSFGQGGQGNLTLLQQLGKQFQFSVITIDPICVQGESVSSTRIRRAIAAGDLELAAACLGYRYTLSGPVIHGAGHGKKLGFPTANIDVGKAQLPPHGVYLARAWVAKRAYQAVMNIGVRPTIHGIDHSVTVEVHLCDFSDDLYGKEIEVELLSFLRAEKKFENEEALREQIKRDLEAGRR